MDQSNNSGANDNLVQLLILKRERRERMLTEPTPIAVIRNMRRNMNMNELRVVESVTKAKRKLQRKYYQGRPI